jgi:hypothetical protein
MRRTRTKTLDVDNDGQQGRMRTRTRDNDEGGQQGRKWTQQSKRGYRQQGMMRIRKMTREDDEGGRGNNNQKEDGSNYKVG